MMVRPGSNPSFVFLLSLLLLPGFLAGCSLFRHETKPTVDVEAPASPDKKVPTPSPKSGAPERKKTAATTRPATPAAKPTVTAPTNNPIAAPVDSVTAPPDAPAPRSTVSAVLTAEQRSILEVQYRTDVERTNQALDSLKGRILTVAEAEQRTSAERFLTESQAAFDLDNLPRAASLVEKARVIAEELKSSTTPK